MLTQYKFLQIICLATLIGLLSACGGKQKPEEQMATKEEKPESTLELSSEQMKAVGITLGKVEQKNLHSVVRASGQLDVPPQNKADVTTLIGGLIRQINVLEGATVQKGQVLAMLENPDFLKLQQEYGVLKNGFAYTEQEYLRQRDLSTGNAGVGKVFQQAEANYRVEKAKIIGLEKQLEQLGIKPSEVIKGNLATQIPIKAPIAGTVSHISAKIGTFAEPAHSLMGIVDNAQIHCDLLVYEKDLFNVKTGQKVSFILTNQDNRQITGTIYGVNRSFENESKAVVVHARISGNHGLELIPGMYVSALIDVGNQSVAALPVDAIIQAEGKNYVFVVDENAANEKEETLHFQKVEVVTGVTELGFTEITPVGKLPTNARVVVKGAFYLLSKMSGGGEEE